MSWAIPESCAALPCAKPKFFGGRKGGLVRRCAVPAIFWAVWMERSKRLFSDAKGEWIFYGTEFASGNPCGLHNPRKQSTLFSLTI